ncbi:hypothetical protein [Gordonia caeni]
MTTPGPYCLVCEKHLTADVANHRDRHGCGPHCLPEHELADRYHREDHQ